MVSSSRPRTLVCSQLEEAYVRLIYPAPEDNIEIVPSTQHIEELARASRAITEAAGYMNDPTGRIQIRTLTHTNHDVIFALMTTSMAIQHATRWERYFGARFNEDFFPPTTSRSYLLLILAFAGPLLQDKFLNLFSYLDWPLSAGRLLSTHSCSRVLAFEAG